MGYLVETKNVKVKIQTVDGKNIMGISIYSDLIGYQIIYYTIMKSLL